MRSTVQNLSNFMSFHSRFTFIDSFLYLGQKSSMNQNYLILKSGIIAVLPTMSCKLRGSI